MRKKRSWGGAIKGKKEPEAPLAAQPLSRGKETGRECPVLCRKRGGRHEKHGGTIDVEKRQAGSPGKKTAESGSLL